MPNTRYLKLICVSCHKRKKDCTCHSHYAKYHGAKYGYTWCVDVGVGAYCDECVNRFYCFTHRGWFGTDLPDYKSYYGVLN